MRTLTAGRLLSAAVRRFLRDPIGVTLLVVRRIVDDPVWLLLKLDDALPESCRRGILRSLNNGRVSSGALRSLVQVASYVRDGDTDGLARFLTERGSSAWRRERAWVGRALVHLEAPEMALQWLAGHGTATDHLVRGAALARRGEWLQARAQLEVAIDEGAGRPARQELRRVKATLRSLDPAWRPRTPPGRPYVPVPRRVVHLLNNSLPYLQTGYTVRSHRVALAQRDVSLEPVMVTRPGFPWEKGYLTAPEHTHHEGISYVHVRDDAAIGTGGAERVTRAVGALAPLVDELRPAVLHPTTPHLNAQVAACLREVFAVPMVYEVRGFLEETWLSRREPSAVTSDHYQLTRQTEARCASEADHVVTLGWAMRDDLIGRGVPAERISVIPNGVDVERFRPTGTGEHVRRAGALEGKVVVGYIGSMEPYEGLDVLVEALAHLHGEGARNIGGLLVGDGPSRSQLEAQAHRLGLDRIVHFPGRVAHEEILTHYEAIDIFVVPRRDARVCRLVTPLKPIEAMAMERAVVLSALPALEELVEPGVSGETFPAEEPLALARVLAELAADAPRRRSLGHAARAAVAEERTWARNAERYLAIYERLGVDLGVRSVRTLPSGP